ncbi:DUF5333 domain-containing protein [Oceaniglobus indicus]|uniref:DUF5333 domain-containing protein n=1 Tax=Oceaniglobus indicus TaxID=2047749 RepID=UPI0011AB7571|nr:DUF5333 domain-containing protein [Oceaniglobus indicus]
MTSLIRTATVAIFLASAGSAQALVPLEQNRGIVAGFYAIGLADEIRKNCPSISPRWVRAYNYLKSLENYARNAGYSDAEIESLTKNKAAKERLRAEIRADLAKRGATPGNPEGYCIAGREEIAKDSTAGRLITE